MAVVTMRVCVLCATLWLDSQGGLVCRDRAAYWTDIVWGTYGCGVWEIVFGFLFFLFNRGGRERLGVEHVWRRCG